MKPDKAYLIVESPSFKDNAPIPTAFTCEGEDISPEVRWSDPPKGTKSFALIMEDPDAPAGAWVHWVVYNIPSKERTLPKALPKNEILDNGVRQGMAGGVNRFDTIGYAGPCPPSGLVHHYYFKLYALDIVLHLPSRATKFDLLKAMEGHLLAQGLMVGLYQR